MHILIVKTQNVLFVTNWIYSLPTPCDPIPFSNGDGEKGTAVLV
jgi:hypothetical protein